jgi:hypothetical protein
LINHLYNEHKVTLFPLSFEGEGDTGGEIDKNYNIRE